MRTRGDAPLRRLLIVPVLHSEADMGSMAPALRQASLERLGRRQHRRKADVIVRGWEMIRRAVMSWTLTWDRVKLYQDGLPVCGREVEIVEALAAAGSANHQLLLDLMAKGATLVGTESAALVTEEYRRVQTRLAAGDEKARDVEAGDNGSADLLLRRDRHIANQINATLRRGETGVLFIGLLHAVEPHLAADIVVVHPVERPALKLLP